MSKIKRIFMFALTMAFIINLNTIVTSANGETNDMKSNVKRDEAAVLIVQFALDKESANKLADTDSVFVDLSSNSLAIGEINWAAERGIIKGDGNGNFMPDKDATGNDVLKMLLCSIGYGRNGEYTGAMWSANVIADAVTYGLLEGIEDYDTSIPATREQIITYISNAEKQLPGVRANEIRLLFTLTGYEDGNPVGTVTANMASNNNAAFKWSETAVSGILNKGEVIGLYTSNSNDATSEFIVTESTTTVTLMIKSDDKYGYIDCMAGETATDMAIVDNVTIPENALLWVAEGTVLTIAEGATLTIEGRLENYGKILNNGKIINNGQFTNNGETQGVSE